MTKIVPLDLALMRERLQQRIHHIEEIEHTYHLVPLGKRLQRHWRLLRQHDLFIAFKHGRYPALYLIKKDHSRWARIWVCADSFRLDAEDHSGSDTSSSWYKLMCRHLSLDPDIAERAIVRFLERDQVKFGAAYLPGNLTTDLDSIQLSPAVPDQTPAALPPPTIDLTAVEVRPAAPPTLRPVTLANQSAPPRKGWFSR